MHGERRALCVSEGNFSADASVSLSCGSELPWGLRGGGPFQLGKVCRSIIRLAFLDLNARQDFPSSFPCLSSMKHSLDIGPKLLCPPSLSRM